MNLANVIWVSLNPSKAFSKHMQAGIRCTSIQEKTSCTEWATWLKKTGMKLSDPCMCAEKLFTLEVFDQTIWREFE